MRVLLAGAALLALFVAWLIIRHDSQVWREQDDDWTTESGSWDTHWDDVRGEP